MRADKERKGKPAWWHMLDRAYKIMEMAGYRIAEHNPDHNNPIVAWMADARVLLQSVPERDYEKLAGLIRECLDGVVGDCTEWNDRARAALSGYALPETQERTAAALHACEGLATVDLAKNEKGWLAEVVHSAARVEIDLKSALRARCPGNGKDDDDTVCECQSYEASEQAAPCPPGCCVMAEAKDVRTVLDAIEREDGAVSAIQFVITRESLANATGPAAVEVAPTSGLVSGEVAMTLERYHEFLGYESECKLRNARSTIQPSSKEK